MKTSTTIKFKASTNMPVDLKDVEVIDTVRCLLMAEDSGFPALLEKINEDLVDYHITAKIRRSKNTKNMLIMEPSMFTISVIITPNGLLSKHYSYEDMESSLREVINYCKHNFEPIVRYQCNNPNRRSISLVLILHPFSHRISLLLNNARKDRNSMTQEYKLNLVNHQECLSVGSSERRAFNNVKRRIKQ